MATVTSKRASARKSQERDERLGLEPTRRRWKFWGVLLFLGLAALVWFAPPLLSCTAVRDWPLGQALAGMNGTIRSGSASLGWFSPVVYRDVLLRDAAGNLLASAATVSGQKTLAGWLLNLNDLGTIRIEQPKLLLVARAGGSNLEDVLAPWWSGSRGAAKSLAIEAGGGQIAVDNQATKEQWQIDEVQVGLRWVAPSRVPVEWSIAGTLQNAAKPAQFSFAYKPARSGSPAAAPQQIVLRTDPLPLALFQPILARPLPGSQFAGTLTADFQYPAAAKKVAASIALPANPTTPAAAGLVPVPLAAADQLLDGQIEVEGFTASGGPLGIDQLHLEQLLGVCRINWHGEQLEIEQLDANCDLGNVALSGFTPTAADSSWRELVRANYTLQGEVDLAELAKRIPHTLHLRPKMQITSGEVRAALTSKSADGGTHVWNGQLETSDLTATEGTRKITWKQPIVASFNAHDGPAGLALDQLDCTSSFLHLSGSGTLAQFSADGTCDLSQLMRELEQFVTLDGIKIAGEGQGKVRLQPRAGGGFLAQADGDIRDFQCTLPNGRPWSEPRLGASLNVSGRCRAAAIDQIDSATLELTAGGAQGNAAQSVIAQAGNKQAINAPPITAKPDKISLQLAEPLSGLAASTTPLGWKLDATLEADLGRSQSRFAAWLPLEGWQLGGQSKLTARLVGSEQGVEMQQMQAEVDGLHAWNGHWFIDEPVVKCTASAKWTPNSGRVRFGPITLLGSTLSLDASDAVLDSPPSGPTALTAKVTYQADLARLLNWLHDPQVQPACLATGRIVGQGTLSGGESANAAKIQTAVEQLMVYGAPPAVRLTPAVGNAAVVTPQYGRKLLWQEQRLEIAADASYDPAADKLQLNSLDLTSVALHLAAKGTVEQCTRQQDAAFAGTVDYDGAALTQALQPYWGPQIHLAGRQTRQFSFKGPLATVVPPVAAATAAAPAAVQPTDALAWLKPLVAEGSLGWTSADLFGMQIGAGEIDAKLADGAVQVKPLDIVVSEGKLAAAPLVRLTPAPVELQLGPGPLVTQMRITPELCAQWLKFVAPMLSEATRTDGRLSMDLQWARVPLDNPKAADIAGRLTIQSVGITPGPAARPFSLLTHQVESIFRRRGQADAQTPSAAPGVPGPSPLVKLGPQQVDFRLVGGRVYHQNLELTVGNVVLRTRGSVGLDETLNLVAEMPVRREWIGTDPQMAQWQNQTVQFAIGGTLRKPQIDPRAIELLTAQMVKNSVRNTITDPLKQELQRVFHPGQ